MTTEINSLLEDLDRIWRCVIPKDVRENEYARLRAAIERLGTAEAERDALKENVNDLRYTLMEVRGRMVGDDWATRRIDVALQFVPAPSPEPPAEAVCEWKWDSDGFWGTGCGHAWSFETGGIKDNGVAFCPFCGKRIVEAK